MSKKEDPFAHLLSALKDLVSWFQKEKIAGVVIGGVAAAILGRPRVTRDIDAVVLVDPDFWGSFLKSGERYGFKSRVSNVLEFARKHRVLLLYHQSSQIQVDISFGGLPFEEECIARSKKFKIGSLSLPLPTPEDLIIMKALPRRGRDYADIQSIIDANPKLDVKRIHKWVKEFAKVLEMPEVFSDLRKLLKRRKK